MALIGEARHGRRERRDGSFSEKLPCPLDTHLDQILVWRQSGRCAKRANDVEGSYSGPLRKRVQRSLVGFGVGILEHITDDADDARLARDPSPRMQCVIPGVPVRVATDQFRDRNARGFFSRRFIEIRGSICIARSASEMESNGGAYCVVERLVRSANNWVTENDRAEFGRLAVARARGLGVQSCHSDRKIDGQIGQGIHSDAYTPRVHFAGRYHHDIALAREAFCSATPERSRSAEYQSERVGVVAVPREGLRLICRSQHFNASAESGPYFHNPSLIQREPPTGVYLSSREPALRTLTT